MPASWTRALLAVALVFGVALSLLLFLVPSAQSGAERSATSRTDEGLLAAYLLLGRLGFPAQVSNAAPGSLHGRGTALLWSTLPPEPPALPPRAAGSPEPPRSRALEHYRRVLAEGGALVVLDAGEETLAFLGGTLGLEAFAGISSEAARDREGTVTIGSESLELGQPFARALGGVPAENVLARGSDGGCVAASFAVGEGRVLLSTFESAWLGNAELRALGEPALFLVRLLEELEPLERLLFDEYALGDWRPPSALGLAFTGPLRWISLQLLVLLLVLLVRSAWSGPFARDPEPLRSASALARARGLASTLTRAGHFATLTQALREGVLARLEARGARPAGLTLAARVERAAGVDPARRARFAAAFLGPPPAGAPALESLGRELAALEHELSSRPLP